MNWYILKHDFHCNVSWCFYLHSTSTFDDIRLCTTQVFHVRWERTHVRGQKETHNSLTTSGERQNAARMHKQTIPFIHKLTGTRIIPREERKKCVSSSHAWETLWIYIYIPNIHTYMCMGENLSRIYSFIYICVCVSAEDNLMMSRYACMRQQSKMHFNVKQLEEMGLTNSLAQPPEHAQCMHSFQNAPTCAPKCFSEIFCVWQKERRNALSASLHPAHKLTNSANIHYFK